MCISCKYIIPSFIYEISVSQMSRDMFHLSIFIGDRVALSLDFCVVFVGHCVSFDSLTIALSVLRFQPFVAVLISSYTFFNFIVNATV
jgi:hypothetical protein